MKARIRELLHAVPFQPFIIRTADGHQYRIEHPDFVLPLPATSRKSPLRKAMGASIIFRPCK
jgi:hypothetical protein